MRNESGVTTENATSGTEKVPTGETAIETGPESKIAQLRERLTETESVIAISRNTVASMKADIKKMREAREDTREEDHQLVELISELAGLDEQRKDLEYRLKQFAEPDQPDQQTKDLKEAENSQMDNLSKALSAAYQELDAANGDEEHTKIAQAEISRLETEMQKQYNTGIIDRSEYGTRTAETEERERLRRRKKLDDLAIQGRAEIGLEDSQKQLTKLEVTIGKEIDECIEGLRNEKLRSSLKMKLAELRASSASLERQSELLADTPDLRDYYTPEQAALHTHLIQISGFGASTNEQERIRIQKKMETIDNALLFGSSDYRHDSDRLANVSLKKINDLYLRRRILQAAINGIQKTLET